MKPSRSNRWNVFRLFVGWGTLLLYSSVCSPFGLGLATVAGELDRSHQIQFCASQQGVRLVLHHSANCSGRRHGMAARALTAFAQPQSVTNPDHVIQFRTAENATRVSALSSAPPSSPSYSLAVSEADLLPPPGIAAGLVSNCTPPGAPASLLCVRSTVLRI